MQFTHRVPGIRLRCSQPPLSTEVDPPTRWASGDVATKHAALALTESLREEMPDFVEVGLICSGFVTSELGPPEVMALGMDTDRFVEIAMAQIKAGEFFIVSHAYNIERINARHDEIGKAFATYAPRYEGDDEFDVRSLASRMQ